MFDSPTHMTQQTLTEVPFGIVRPQSFYTIQGVKLPSDAYVDVQVTEKLLDNGRSRTQSGWRDYRKETGWGPGSGPLITAVLTTLYDNRNAEGVDELRKIFGDDFRKHWMMTATGITYRAGASDIVTHDPGTPEQRTLDAPLVGLEGRVNERMSDEIEALLGNRDTSKVGAVYKWVTGKESYLWRLNKQPKQNVGRALALGDGLGVVFGIYAGDVIDGRPARGVRIVPPQNSTGSKG